MPQTTVTAPNRGILQILLPRVLFSICVLVLCITAACTAKGLKRPYGYMRLGTIAELSVPETYLPDQRLLIRFDGSGFSVMSTMCTLDLTPLTRSDEGGKVIWRSSYSSSTYGHDGNVLTGPTKSDLPHYNIKVDSSVYGGVKDTLYAEIGSERPSTWRFVP